MRLRNDPNAKNILNSSSRVIKDFPYLLSKKVILEIGMGKGEMITQMAKQNSNLIFIGIEKYATVAEKALKKADEMNLKNFFIINNDINDIIELLKGETETIWFTFSDPWPKNRHEKRRLTHSSFLQKYKKIINKNGIIKIKTDNDNFFNYSKKSLLENNFKIIFETNDLHRSHLSKKNIQTDYEKKWSKLGKNINYLEAKK